MFSRDRFMVFAGAAYVATVPVQATSAAILGGDLFYCPYPKIDPTAFLGKSTVKDQELAPLWVRAEVDGSREDVLLRVDQKRLDPDFPNPSEWAMTLAPRTDGKLWLVGVSSGEVLLATQAGRILKRTVLPFRFPTEQDDPQQRQSFLAEAEEEARSAASDATQPPSEETVLLTGRTRIFWHAWARGQDLVLLTTPFTKPASAVLVYRGADREIPCFTFNDVVKGDPVIAVTDDALWLAEPFGYFLWEELEELLQVQTGKNGKGGRSSSSNP
ncbi:MAG: hypothetical protein ACP5NF_11740 [Thermoanaerobaculum sp.]